MRKRAVLLSWLWVILCAASILAIVPVARSIQRLVTKWAGRSAFGYFVLSNVVLFLGAMLWLLIFRLRVRRLSSYLCLAAVGFLYVYFTLKLWAHPEEAVHFLEYGLLSFLLFRALRHHFSDGTIYFSAFFLGSLVGIIDEIYQWITPNRYWDWRDVGLNALAVLLFQVALAFAIRPKGLSGWPAPRSFRFASLALATNLIFLGLCFSNTPARVASYSRLIPQLAFLQKEEIMHDFQKKKHDVPGIGLFISRLSLEEIKEIDQARGEELAAILREWANRPYEEFLRTFSAQKEPFLHEFRVRVFRRDQKLLEANKRLNGPKKEKAQLAAFRENLFLEKYFGRTLQASGYAWPPELVASLAPEIDPKAAYRSPVGAGFSPFQDERTLWLTILLLLLILVIANIIYGYCSPSRPQKRPERKPSPY